MAARDAGVGADTTVEVGLESQSSTSGPLASSWLAVKALGLVRAEAAAEGSTGTLKGDLRCMWVVYGCMGCVCVKCVLEVRVRQVCVRGER